MKPNGGEDLEEFQARKVLQYALKGVREELAVWMNDDVTDDGFVVRFAHQNVHVYVVPTRDEENEGGGDR